MTFNLRDFPTAALSGHGVVAQHPDTFLTERFDENSAIVAEAIRRMSAATRNPHRTVAEIIARLEASDLPILAGRLRGYLHPAATPGSTVNP